MTTTMVRSTKIDGTALRPHLDALLGASGITEEQARICLLYTLCTCRKDIDKIPILAIMGMTGTGKSSLLQQILYLVNNPKLATGNTDATIRNEMVNCITYVFDEADGISEKLLLQRTDKDISNITVNEGTGHGWKPKTQDIFGATILARRNPFRDSAVRNRAIVIRTQHNPADYKVIVVPRTLEIAQSMKIEKLLLGSGRVRDTWTPLLEIAKAIDDPSFEDAIENTMKAEQVIFKSGQQYEASEVVLYALDKLTWDGSENKRVIIDADLGLLTETANDIGDVQLTKKLVEELLISIGFKVTFTHGTKLVRANVELLESLV